MPSNLIHIAQDKSQIIDISSWVLDAEYEGVYPKGAREKKAVYCPCDCVYDFLIPSRRYLFKRAFSRYPEQFFVEIICYKIGCMMGVEVPPTFIAIDSSEGDLVCGSLVQWFYDETCHEFERYVDGSDILPAIIEGFNVKTGEQHNFITMLDICNSLKSSQSFEMEPGLITKLLKMLVFDALIGNTDRHQENWGFLFHKGQSYETLLSGTPKSIVSLSPAFDNGTSMGHEIIERKFKTFDLPGKMDLYIRKGTHHMRWSIEDSVRTNHIDLILKIAELGGNFSRYALKWLDINLQEVEDYMRLLTEFELPVKLSPSRVDFMFKLISTRHSKLVSALREF